MSVFAHLEQVPGDPILGLTEAFNADARTDKVNLGVGIYYDEAGRIPLLRAVDDGAYANLEFPAIIRRHRLAVLPAGSVPRTVKVQGATRLLLAACTVICVPAG